jgi:hypothetical protein
VRNEKYILPQYGILFFILLKRWNEKYILPQYGILFFILLKRWNGEMKNIFCPGRLWSIKDED